MNISTGDIVIADIVIDTRRREVQRSGKAIRLTTREYEIIIMLAEANGEPVSKQALLRLPINSSPKSITLRLPGIPGSLFYAIKKG